MELKDFKDTQYINLITYKKDGSPVTTPVWVALFKNSLVITTGPKAGKVKRIRNNGKATIYTTNQSGSAKLSESLDLQGVVLENEIEKSEASKLIKKKYGLTAKMMMRGPDSSRAIIQLTETRGK